MNVAESVPRLDDEEILIAEPASQRLEPRDHPCVFNVRQDRRRRARELRSEQAEEYDADCSTQHARRPPALADAAQCRGGGEEEGAGENDRKESACHPEVIRSDPNLVEKKEREHGNGGE